MIVPERVSGCQAAVRLAAVVVIVLLLFVAAPSAAMSGVANISADAVMASLKRLTFIIILPPNS
jgi:hypothetical protein